MIYVSRQWALKLLMAHYGPMIELEDKATTGTGHVALHVISRYVNWERVVEKSITADNYYLLLKMSIPGIFAPRQRELDYLTQGYADELTKQRKDRLAKQRNSAGGSPKKRH